MNNAAVEQAGSELEKFAASSSRWLGVAGSAIGVFLAAGALLDGPSDSLGLFGVGLCVALLSWAILVRPAVAAHTNGLLLKNILRDTYLPWAAIAGGKVNQTLQVVTRDDKQYHGVALGRSTRKVLRERRSQQTPVGGSFGLGGAAPTAVGKDPSRRAAEEASDASYVEHVEATIRRLAGEAEADQDPRPIVSWAVVPTAMVVVGILCLTLMFV